MKIYNYKEGTNEFLSEGTAKPNPLEPGKYLIPRNATTIEPTLIPKENETLVFENNQWIIKEDYRNIKVYNNEFKEGKEITELGPLPEGFSLTQPTSEYAILENNNWIEDIELIRSNKKQEVDNKRDEILSSGISYNFPDGVGIIQTRDQKDERNIQANTSAAQAYIMLNQPQTEMKFRDMEDVIHTMTATQMLEMCLYVKSYGQSIYEKSWQIKDEIKNIQDVEVLKNYIVNFEV